MNLVKRVSKVVKKGIVALLPMLGAVILRHVLGFASFELWPRIFPTPSFTASLLQTSVTFGIISIFLGFVVCAVECIFNFEKEG